MNLTTPILHPLASHPLADLPPNTGHRGPSFYQETVGVDPEICACGARMIVDDEVTDGAKIAETLARLGRRFASVNRPSQEAAIDW